MNIDERIEALTHRVGLVAGMQLETEKRMAVLIDTVNRIGIATEDREHRIRGLEGHQ